MPERVRVRGKSTGSEHRLDVADRVRIAKIGVGRAFATALILCHLAINDAHRESWFHRYPPLRSSVSPDFRI